MSTDEEADFFPCCSMLFSSDSDPDDVVEELDPEELPPPPPAAEVRFRSLSSRLHRLRRLFTYTQRDIKFEPSVFDWMINKA